MQVAEFTAAVSLFVCFQKESVLECQSSVPESQTICLLTQLSEIAQRQSGFEQVAWTRRRHTLMLS